MAGTEKYLGILESPRYIFMIVIQSRLYFITTFITQTIEWRVCFLMFWMQDFYSTCRQASDPLSMSSMTRPSCTDRPEEAGRPLKTPRTWITNGLPPIRIMSISRSKEPLVLCACACFVRNLRPHVIALIGNFVLPLTRRHSEAV